MAELDEIKEIRMRRASLKSLTLETVWKLGSCFTDLVLLCDNDASLAVFRTIALNITVVERNRR